MKKKIFKCKKCNKSFEGLVNMKQIFCSRKCYWTAYPKIKITCSNCKKEFLTFHCYKERKYCSIKCMYKDEKWKLKQRMQLVTLKTREKISKGNKGKQTGDKNGNYKHGLNTIKRVLREKANGICQICNEGIKGELGFLDMHHKDMNRHNNTLENFLYICPNCHRKEHLKEKGKYKKLNIGN